MSRVKKIIHDLSELYKNLFKEEESIESETMDFLLQEMEKKSAETRKRIADLGFWTEDGEYKEDLQEVTEYDTLWRNV